MDNLKKKYFGTWSFYRHALIIMVPMVLQNLITNFVSMLDNIMVGRVGTEPMSGVSIVNQFMFVFNITIFGGVSGASIFGTQFFGKGDSEGQRYTFRFRIILATILIGLAMVIFILFDDELIRLFLSDKDAPEVVQATLNYGKQYLSIMLIGLIPFGIGQAYSSVVRECGETRIPMYGSVAAIFVNLILDYGLIFGKLGMPELGVRGAAIATVIAKMAEALVVIVWAHKNKEKNLYIVDVYKSLNIPKKLTMDIIRKGMPLLANEFFWAFGMSIIAQSYSILGIDVVAARNISGTLTNLFNVIFIQMGATIGIIVGAELGAGKLEEAKDTAVKLMVFGLLITVVVSILMVPFAFIFPGLYKTNPEVQQLATFLVLISALAMPIWSYTNSTYFTLRSGGKTGITFLFDFVFTWVVMIPLAFCLTRFSSLGIRTIFCIVTFSELLKVVVGYFMVKSGIWVNNIVD